MTDTETDFDDAASETKPRKSRKRNASRKVTYYQMINGDPKELGTFPETTIGTLSQRNIISFAKDFPLEGDIRTQIKEPNGRYGPAFDFSIAGTEKPSQTTIDIEPEEFEDDLEENELENNGDLLKLHFENRSLKKDIETLANEIRAIKTGKQNENQAEISALERAHAQTVEILMMMISRADKPQQDATTQALNMLEKSFGIVNRAKSISDAISPNDTGGGGSSTMLGDAAKIIESVGRHAPTFIPLLGGMLGGGTPKTSVRPARPQTAPTASGDGQSGNLADLAKKVQKKEVKK
jgi:hypothetical protein